ncbi:hypothetical protein SCHPADRAFT_263560 [Schizopora paradoxa]|uniref:NACHT domain-containing protein n=1 Tax=Schizopora paradoxa TaxID=27342 RepID=A0A0H2RU20_9AGAM|nr:hypothetical protein SCHPADRAFT_263560 [Schizopora paradoxa]
MDDRWLEGSRKTVMLDVDTWLRSSDKPNVLWISGNPGAGKTAIASEIVRKKNLDPSSDGCVEFFIKRGRPALDDPRTIWRSIAMGLVSLFSTTDMWHRSIKADILEVVTPNAGHLYPKNVSIDDQFRDLICRPLNNLFELTTSRRIVIVIDALDECSLSDTDQWSEFLGTVVKWSTELPKGCKLVLTSRSEPEIEEKLKGISQLLVLDTNNYVSESFRDIKDLFDKRFKEKVEPEKINDLARYADGLFIWATTVIEYVNHGTFAVRLKDVLRNMPAPDARDSDKIGALYGKILLRVGWERRNHPDELDRMSLVLASIIPGILCRPLPIRALGSLLSPNLEDINDVGDVAGKLNSIIACDGADKTPRIRHKSFPDFLSDWKRVEKTMTQVITEEYPKAEESEQARFLNLFSLVHQRALVAESCLLLMVRCTEDVNPIPLNADTLIALVYACIHWVNHIPDAEVGSDMTDSKPLVYSAPPGETLSRLQEGTLHWLKGLSLSGASPGSDAVLHKVATSVNVLHELRSFLVDSSDQLHPEAMRKFANTHPIMHRIKMALEVAGKLSEKKREITKALVMDMCDSLMYVTDDHPEARREYPKHGAAELMEIVVKSSRYVIDFASKDVALADFRKEISDYRKQVRDCRRESELVPNLVKKGFLSA